MENGICTNSKLRTHSLLKKSLKLVTKTNAMHAHRYFVSFSFPGVCKSNANKLMKCKMKNDDISESQHRLSKHISSAINIMSPVFSIYYYETNKLQHQEHSYFSFLFALCSMFIACAENGFA